VVAEPPFIGGETFLLGEPAENLALQGAALLQTFVAISSTCRLLKTRI
jgi:hypothetical protein